MLEPFEKSLTTTLCVTTLPQRSTSTTHTHKRIKKFYFTEVGSRHLDLHIVLLYIFIVFYFYIRLIKRKILTV